MILGNRNTWEWSMKRLRRRMVKEMTLKEARECLSRHSCEGCKFHNSEESCLEKAHEIAVSCIEIVEEMEKGSTGCKELMQTK